jgi:hypothetical protein
MNLSTATAVNTPNDPSIQKKDQAAPHGEQQRHRDRFADAVALEVAFDGPDDTQHNDEDPPVPTHKVEQPEFRVHIAGREKAPREAGPSRLAWVNADTAERMPTKKLSRASVLVYGPSLPAIAQSRIAILGYKGHSRPYPSARAHHWNLFGGRRKRDAEHAAQASSASG